MTKYLFSSKSVRAAVLTGAFMFVPAAASHAATLPVSSTGTTSTYVSLAGTSLLGTTVPVLGTDGWTITLPVGVNLPSQFQFAGIDFTVVASAQVGNLQLFYLDVDPRMI